MRSVLRPWIPAALVVVLAAILLHVGADVAWRDIAVFGCYVVGWLILPGTLLWRALDRGSGRRTLFADLAIGAMVGYVIEFPAYLACLAAGVPHLYVAWPAVAVLATVTHPAGRRLWTRPVTPLPRWWSWTAAMLMAYVVIWFAHVVWGPSPVTAPALRSPYVDEPFHLSLVTELRHHFRPQNPFVDGQPLYYHWLSHLHMAAASWVTGTTPIVLLRSLALPMAFALCALGTAAIAMRLSGTRWVGLIAMGLQLLGPLDFSGWRAGGEGPLDVRLMNSPSAGFANVAVLLGILLSIEIIRGRSRGWAPYALVVLVFVAMFGAKSTSLPTVIAGLLGVVAFTLVSQRRLDRPAATLSVLSIVVFVAVKPFFFGSGTRGLALDLFGLFGENSLAVGAIGATVRLIVYWALALPLLLLLTRRSGRTPEAILLFCLAGSGFAAALATHQSGYSEWYFAWGVLVPMTLGSALGIHQLVLRLREVAARRARLLIGTLCVVVLGSVVIVEVYLGLMPTRPPFASPTTVGAAFHTEVVPLLVTALIVALLVMAGTAAARRGTGLPARVLAAPVLVAVVMGFGGHDLATDLGDAVADPIPRQVRPTGPLLIGAGGLAAAAWIQSHSAVDDLIATNAHCDLPGVYPCATRNFWMAAYTQRHVLVEGWSYIRDDPSAPFWQPAKLAANDAAFTDPSLQTVRRLRSQYGVRWLLVDRRFPAKIAALSNVIAPVHTTGAYLIYDLDRPPVGAG